MYNAIVLAAFGALLAHAGVVPRGSSTTEPDNATAPPIPRWDCEVRAWTRAPDLAPNTAIPAEVRLALNGSDCADIVSWKAGLRFKERAIVKLK